MDAVWRVIDIVAAAAGLVFVAPLLLSLMALIWMSDGGRDYAPWEGRNKRCIGLEDICGYFHLGTGPSVADNPVAASGTPTAVTLGDRPVSLSTVFGVAATPAGFGRVKEVVKAPGGINLVDAGGRKAFAAVDLAFIGA